MREFVQGFFSHRFELVGDPTPRDYQDLKDSANSRLSRALQAHERELTDQTAIQLQEARIHKKHIEIHPDDYVAHAGIYMRVSKNRWSRIPLTGGLSKLLAHAT